MQLFSTTVPSVPHMPLQSLTIAQKRKIVKEHARHLRDGQKATPTALAEWAKETLNLSKEPEKIIMSRMMTNKLLWREKIAENLFRNTSPSKVELDRALYGRMYEMSDTRRDISG